MEDTKAQYTSYIEYSNTNMIDRVTSMSITFDGTPPYMRLKFDTDNGFLLVNLDMNDCPMIQEIADKAMSACMPSIMKELMNRRLYNGRKEE